MTTLVIGGTGKTGRRIVQRLTDRGAPVRVGSRSAEPPFDWSSPDTWSPVLSGVTAVYISFYPDLSMPGAADSIGAVCAAAVRHGARRIVLLSGRGEPETWPAEQAVRDSGADWTVLRASWFAQNFSEAFLLDAVRSGVASGSLDVPDAVEPFVDADDVADVAVAALTEPGHAGRTYELTGPRLLSFGDAVAAIAEAVGRPVRTAAVPPSRFTAGLGLPPAIADVLANVLDGRNAHLTDHVRQAAGREPTDFAVYARRAASTGVWG
jgi:uncharacterized protein YbjT (DUF2867 family)